MFHYLNKHFMNKQEALLIPDLQIEVTPLVEDAFYAYRDIDDSELDARLKELGDNYIEGDEEADKLLDRYLKDIEFSEKARERWFATGSASERVDALMKAQKMIENIKKHGVPCAQWCN